MLSTMEAYVLLYSTEYGYFLEIAVVLILLAIYQLIMKIKSRRGNDLVMVLLTGNYTVLHISR